MRGKLSVYNIKRNQIGSPPQVRGKRYRRIYNIKSGNGSPPQVRGKREVRTTPRVTLRITPAGAGKTFSPAVNYRNKKDHPRRCGENRQAATNKAAGAGSPPQVRGKQGACINQRRYQRITPAGAGKTVRVYVAKSGSTDHPRRCGENQKVLRNILRLPGSPPQVRGKRFIIRCGKVTTRITPAGAGKTHSLYTFRNLLQDHPRRCGENIIPQKIVFHIIGSPPQVRGKHIIAEWFN